MSRSVSGATLLVFGVVFTLYGSILLAQSLPLGIAELVLGACFIAFGLWEFKK